MPKKQFNLTRVEYISLADRFIRKVQEGLPGTRGKIRYLPDGQLWVSLKYESREDSETVLHKNCCGACQGSELSTAIEKAGTDFMNSSTVLGGGTLFRDGDTTSDVDFAPAGEFRTLL